MDADRCSSFAWWRLSIAALFFAAPLWSLRAASRTAAGNGRLHQRQRQRPGPVCLGRELDGAIGVAVSPDSRNVYVASSVDAAVAVFDIDPGTGGLVQKAGQDGCVSESGSLLSCEDGRALLQAWAVAVSPDGRNVYVASFQSDAVLIFDRDPDTGAIDQKPGLAGCISQDGTGLACTDSFGLDGAHDVAVTPDGRQVLVVGLDSNSLVTFDRDPSTGDLDPLECFTVGGTEGCTDVIAIEAASGVTVSPDGRNVYVAAGVGDAVAMFERDPSIGTLQQPADSTACVSETGNAGACADGEALDGAFDVAVGTNGRNVYAVALSE